MNTAQIKRELSADYQRAVGEFVGREVIYCVSELISHLCQAAPDDEDLFNVCVSDDWESAAYDAGWRGPESDEYGATIFTDETDGQTWACADYQELCEAHDIEPYQREALEHWIVSDYLAGKLEAAGEMIARDIHGLTVWGRCTSGQAILLDAVICGIYNDCH